MRYQNMEECECDRCGDKEFLQKDSPNQSNWHNMQRLNADAQTKPFLLCEGCFLDYKEFMKTADKEFAEWMEEKR